MKIVYFVTNGVATPEDHKKATELRDQGNKVFFSNGSVKTGFQDSCDAVVIGGEFKHVKEWAESKGIKIIEEEKPVDRKRVGRKPKLDAAEEVEDNG